MWTGSATSFWGNLMIDLHTHILPGVDDGSPDAATSAQMLALLHQQGVDTLAATPHFYAWNDTPEAFLQRRQQGFERLQEAKIDTSHILPGAEVAYFDGMSKSQVLQQLQLGNTGLLLVEMPFRSWNDRIIQEICQLPIQQNLQPVLAHVDRYGSRQQLPKYMDILLSNGVLFQCNADAFLSGWGSRKYFKMLAMGQLHFLGSDCHNLTSRAPNLGAATAIIEKKIGPGLLPELTAYARELLFP